MTREEFLKQLKSLEEEFDSVKREFNKRKGDIIYQYVVSNAKYKVGDIIEDYRGTRIKVEDIGYFSPFGGDNFVTTYFGTELYKNNEPNYRGLKYTVDEREVSYVKN